jgi:hypothetical protein
MTSHTIPTFTVQRAAIVIKAPSSATVSTTQVVATVSNWKKQNAPVAGLAATQRGVAPSGAPAADRASVVSGHNQQRVFPEFGTLQRVGNIFDSFVNLVVALQG